MATVTSDNASIHYTVKGQGSPVLLVAGLAGVGSSWGPQIDLFAARHVFAMRRRMLADSGLRASTEANALFLFDPRFMREHPERVQAWVDAAASAAFDLELSLARIDMIVGHDAFDDLPSISTPTLVLVGERDFCAPPHFSAELAERIPGAEFGILDGGHFIFLEAPELVHDTIEAFIAKHEA